MIGDYIARDSPAAAGRIVIRILDQAELLAAHPHAGRAGRVPATREMIVSDTPFILPYRVKGDVVEVLAVFHGARQWPESFE
jgi:toxin ParE1/3/4